MRCRTAVVLTIPAAAMLAGCRVFPAPTMPGTAYATTSTTPGPVEDDVRITACGPGATAQVTVVNHVGGSADYTVGVEFRDAAGSRVAAGVAPMVTVPAGAMRRLRVDGAPVAAGALACSLAQATRVS